MMGGGQVGHVVEAVRAPLGGLGFRKRAGAVFTVSVEDDVLGWLGLNTATKHHADAVEVNPVIGVRHQLVERLVARLTGDKFHAYLPPTVSTPLGYLMPEARYRAWMFSAGEMTEAASSLVAAVGEFGVSFVASNTSLESLQGRLEEGLGMDTEYRLPVVLDLLGLHQEAAEAAETSLRDLGERNDPAAQRLRGFVDRFRDQQPLTAAGER